MDYRVAALLAFAAPWAAAFHLPITHSGLHLSRRATCIVSASASPADATSLDGTGQMASKIADRLTAKLDAEWGEQEDHARVGVEAGRFYCEARAAGTVDIGELLMAVVRPNPAQPRPNPSPTSPTRVTERPVLSMAAHRCHPTPPWQGTGMQGVDMGDCFVGPWDIANDASDAPKLVESGPASWWRHSSTARPPGGTTARQPGSPASW